MLCLVTDRHRLSRGAPFDAARARLLEQARWARTNGVTLLQVRERDLDASQLAPLVSDLLRVCRGSGTRVVVNDRADVALACGADGVHLRHDSMAADRLRSIVPRGFLIGRSVRDAAEAERAGPVDYLIAGTVFPTESKAGGAGTIGLAGLESIVRSCAVPVLAIGGMTPDLLAAVEATGAAGVAGIGLFIRWFDTREAPS
jgi:thiamine-phosphate pyrophosphorylase